MLLLLLLLAWLEGTGVGVLRLSLLLVLLLPLVVVVGVAFSLVLVLLLVLLCLADPDPGVVHPGASIGSAHDDSASSSDEGFLKVRDFLEPSPWCLDADGFVVAIATIGNIWSSLTPPTEQSASLLDGLPNVLSL